MENIYGNKLISHQVQNVWKYWEWFESQDIGCCTSWSWETSNSILSHVNSCFNGQKGNWVVFCIILWPYVTSNETWIHYNNPKCRSLLGKPSHTSTKAAKPNIHGSKLLVCIWWRQLGVVYYDLLKPTETITVDHYWLQLMHMRWPLKKKWLLYKPGHNKVFL